MESPMVMQRAYGRTRQGGLGRLTLLALIGIALCLIYLQIALIGQVIPPLAIFAVVSLVVAGLVWIGWRWTPLLGALWSFFIVAGNTENIVYNLTHPDDVHSFAFTTILLCIAAVGVISGIAGAIQNYRRGAGEQRVPRWGRYSLTALAGLGVGAILVAAIPKPGAAVGVSAGALAAMPALTTANFAFTQPEIRARVGETVALRLENQDRESHSFDVDELNIHAPMPSGEAGLALFRPDKPGTYTFYCGVPGHKDAMQGKLIVTP